MKKQINKLIAIAEQYVETAKKLGFELDTHNHIRSNLEKTLDIFSACYNTVDKDKPEIKLYFGDEFKTWSLDYGITHKGGIDVNGYKRSVEIPYDITAKKLDEVIKDLEEVLPILQAFESKAVEIAENKKKAEIDELEAKIKKLKEV